MLWALMVDYFGANEFSPAHVEQTLREHAPSPGDQPAAPTIATWGTTPEARQGQAAMMQLLG